MPTTTIPESHRDLIETGPIVMLATIGPDGFPQVTATWFLVEEDGTIAASLNTAGLTRGRWTDPAKSVSSSGSLRSRSTPSDRCELPGRPGARSHHVRVARL